AATSRPRSRISRLRRSTKASAVSGASDSRRSPQALNKTAETASAINFFMVVASSSMNAVHAATQERRDQQHEDAHTEADPQQEFEQLGVRGERRAQIRDFALMRVDGRQLGELR